MTAVYNQCLKKVGPLGKVVPGSGDGAVVPQLGDLWFQRWSQEHTLYVFVEDTEPICVSHSPVSHSE